MGSLCRHVALVTGASRGIGRACALTLARAGARVAVNYHRRREQAEAVVREIEKQGGVALAFQADVANSAQVKSMVQEIREKLGVPDILVANAGVGDAEYPGAWELEEDAWDRVLVVNLKGVYNCVRAVLPHLIERKWGRIIAIASTSGITGGTSGIHYAASKGGVIALCRALARECAPFGVTVNVIAPSKIDTDLLRSVTLPEKMPELIRKIPVGRLGKPEDIARAVLFFAEEEAGYVTGQVLTVSGGY
ncbi:MAG: 3-oxoacyl-ACP reductase FabG [Candidatus Atribacteria bacterium]|nr:3-oxoacyl-ACP reductase FabG [Candidatus Atribacteria bacterium]MCD6349266.1 3-oxoacyl-ACP reductase FabG [Candidatus Atribacteria bacterium]